MNQVTEKRRALYRLAGHEPSQYDNHVILDLCTACGADCVYCLHQAAGLATPKLMSRETFFAIADILHREAYELVYLYQSGESLLHPEYAEFLAAIAERGMNSSTATKLFMPIDFRELERALTCCDRTGSSVEFLITVDAIDQGAQDKIGPGIRTELLKKNLARMAKLDRAHPSVTCVLDTVVNAHNEQRLDEIADYLKSVGFGKWYPRRMGYYMPSLARKKDLDAIAVAVPKSEEHPARFRIVNGAFEPYEEQTRCDLGAPAVSPEGDVTICCHDMLHLNRLGNVVEQGSLRAIIASETFQAAANKGRCMELPICQGCN